MKGLLRKITNQGRAFAGSKSEERSIILSNYASLICSAALLFLIAALIAFYGWHASMFNPLLPASMMFMLPLVLNRFGFIVASRVFLCLLVPLLVFGISILDLRSGAQMSAASFVGLRLFLLVGLCFPFLLFDLKQQFLLISGLSFQLFSIVFFDPVFHLFGVGYHPSGNQDLFYEFSNVRALIAAFAIGSCLFILKLVVENTERLNQNLLSRLEEQNKLIKRQAEAEVYQLNEMLNRNLQQLSEREFILNQSQRVAKVGSWEYDIRKSFTFWSEEMYNILELDSSVNLKSKDNFKSMFGTESKTITQSTIELMRTGRSFDITVPFRTARNQRKWMRIYGFPRLDDQRIIGARGVCHDITFYKEAEEKLRTSEYKYRSLFEQASDFIAVLDFEGKFHDVNDSWCAASGYTREELLNMQVEQLVDPGQLQTAPIQYNALKGGEHIYSYRRMVRKNKTILELESNAKRLQDGLILVIGRDVTMFRAAQRQIEESEARFRGAFEFSAIGMALVSVEGIWLKVNAQLCQILGRPEAELLNLKVRDFMYPEETDEDDQLQQQLLDGRRDSFQGEKRFLHRNGAYIWVHLNVSIAKGNDGTPLYFVVQIEDITGDKEAREKLIVNEANMEATINNTELLIWSVDVNFNLVMFNNQFANHMRRHYGIELQIGSRIFSSRPPAEGNELTDKWVAMYNRALSGHRITLDDHRFGIDFQYSLSPIIRTGEVIGVSIFADNVTERKARDRELAEANRKIGELRLMALRSVMSPHFIFNVLNSIQYFITKNDGLSAINYLSGFSKLVRGILNHSVTNKIRLSDEIEMLQNYVQLEMTRFENKFEFSLTVDPGIEPESVVIPSLLIQPYVENAILHGLYNKKGPGVLSIRIKEEEADTLLFEIEDNGIGRAAAMELRKLNFLPHTPMGINITEERLKLINQGHQAAFEVEDLQQSGRPSGTLVKIRISCDAG